jgi:hypothetical protein
MSATRASTEDHDEPGLYEIRIKGHLDDRWSSWFRGPGHAIALGNPRQTRPGRCKSPSNTELRQAA